MGILFSEKSIFHLNQLSNIVSKKSALRFRLNDDNGVRDLLRHAASLNDQHVAMCKTNFINSLQDRERESLIGGVKTPARQLFSNTWFAAKAG